MKKPNVRFVNFSDKKPADLKLTKTKVKKTKHKTTVSKTYADRAAKISVIINVEVKKYDSKNKKN